MPFLARLALAIALAAGGLSVPCVAAEPVPTGLTLTDPGGEASTPVAVEPVDGLVAGLSSASASVRAHAMEALSRRWPEASASLPAVVEACELSIREARAELWPWLFDLALVDPAVRGIALRGVRHRDPIVSEPARRIFLDAGTSSVTVSEALELLDQDDAALQILGIDTLSHLPDPLGAALPRLQPLLQNPSSRVRLAAVEMLAKPVGDAALKASWLIGLLTDTEAEVRATACRSLAALRAPTEGLVDALHARIGDEDAGVRAAAMQALRWFTFESPAVLEAAKAALQDRDPRVQAAAITLVAVRSTNLDEHLPWLLSTLERDDHELLITTLACTHLIDRFSPELIQRLMVLTEHRNAKVRAEAISALSMLDHRIPSEERATLEALFEKIARATRDPASEVKLEALLALRYRLSWSTTFQTLVLACLEDSDPKVRQAAATTAGAIGADAPRAVPALIKALEDPEVAFNAAESLGAFATASADVAPALLPLCASSSRSLAVAAARSLCALPAHASVILPVLMREFEAPPERFPYHYLSDLRRLGRAADPAAALVASASLSAEAYNRGETAETLAVMSPGHPIALGALARLAQDADALTQQKSLTALDAHGKAGARLAIPALMVPHGRGRTLAARLVRKLAPDPAILPLVVPLLKDDSLETRQEAIDALADWGGRAAPYVPQLVGFLSGEGPMSWDLKDSAATTLAKIGKPAVPAVIAVARAEGHPGRPMALSVLTQMKPTPPGTYPVMLTALWSGDTNVRMAAVQRIRELPIPAKDAVPALAGLLRRQLTLNISYDEISRMYHTIEALGDYGADSIGAMPVLAEALAFDRDGDYEYSYGVVLRASNVIAHFGRAARPLVPELLHAMARLDGLGSAERALEAIDRPEVEDVPDIARALSYTGNWTCREVRLRAAKLLGKVGPAAAPAVPALVRALRDEEAPVRAAAAETLGRTGRQGLTAMGALKAAHSDPDPSVRVAAKRAWSQLRRLIR